MANPTIVRLCGTRAWCGTRRCVCGVHLPLPDIPVGVYTTATGAARHMESTCSQVRRARTSHSVESYFSVEPYLCQTCRRVPDQVEAFIKASTSFARTAATILRADTDRSGRIDTAVANTVAKARRQLVAKVWPDSLASQVGPLAALADAMLDTTTVDWQPEPMGEATLRACAAWLIGADVGPAYRTGSRPPTDADPEAFRLCPPELIERRWDTWFKGMAEGWPVTFGPSCDEGFPGRRDALSMLTGAWDRMVADLVANPGPSHVVTLPVVTHPPGSQVSPLWVVHQLANHAVFPLTTASGKNMIVAVVPELVVGLLARVDNALLAHLGPLPKTRPMAVLDTMRGLWDGQSRASLRTAFTTATLV